MREKFRETLERYRDNIVDQKKIEQEDEERLERLVVAADVEIERRARAVGVKKDVQKEIFEMQQEKQVLMAELKRIMKIIDSKEEFEFAPSEDQRVVRYDEGREAFLIGEGESEEEASLGEVCHDGDFGVRYAMDYSDQSIPRSSRKKFAVETVKRELQRLLDRQIVSEEVARTEFGGVKRAYESFLNPEEMRRSGKLAEQLVGYFLKRLETDGALPFGFETADVYEDVARKIDFVIKKRRHIREIQTESNNHESIGIQLTMRTDRYGIEHKKEQIERVKSKSKDLEVEDILLVSLPIENIQTIFFQAEDRQQETGKTAGGPVSFLLNAEKEYLIRGIFQDFLEKEEIEKMIARMRSVHSRDTDRMMEEEARIEVSWKEARSRSVSRLQHEGQVRKDKKRKEEHRRAREEEMRRETEQREKMKRLHGKEAQDVLKQEMREIDEERKAIHEDQEARMKHLRESGADKNQVAALMSEMNARREALARRKNEIYDIIKTGKKQRTEAHLRLIEELLERQSER